MAICTEDKISPAPTPKPVKPRMRSPSASTSAFRNPRVSDKCTCAHHCCHRDLEHTIRNAACSRFVLTQAHARKFRVGKQTKRNESSCRYAVAAGEAGMDHPKIVKTDVCELRTTCDLADRPNARRRGLQRLIHDSIAATRCPAPSARPRSKSEFVHQIVIMSVTVRPET